MNLPNVLFVYLDELLVELVAGLSHSTAFPFVFVFDGRKASSFPFETT